MLVELGLTKGHFKQLGQDASQCKTVAVLHWLRMSLFQRSYLRTCVALLSCSRVHHGGPSAAGSLSPRRWASGSPGSPWPRQELQWHREGNTGWREEVEYSQGPVAITKIQNEILSEAPRTCHSRVNLTFSKLCFLEGHLFNHCMAASNTTSSLVTLRKSLAIISVSLSTLRERNSSWQIYRMEEISFNK